MPDVKRDTVIPDHSLSGLPVEEGHSQTSISKSEFAALIMLFNTTRNLLPVRVFGIKLYVKLLQTALPHNVKPRCIPEEGETLSESMFKSGWQELASKTLIDLTGKKKDPNATNLMVMVFADNKEDTLNSVFHISINKSKQKYFLNSNCSPTQALSGRNDLPLNAPPTAEMKARFFVDLFVLPFRILGQLLDKHVYKHTKQKSGLTKSVEKGEVALQKVQLAAYTPEFNSKVDRQHALVSLYQIYSAEVYRIDGTGSNVAHVLNCILDKSKTEIITDKETGALEGITGFMLRIKYGTQGYAFSLGMYAKDEVQRIKQQEAFAFGQYGLIGRKEPTRLTEKSIRLDLNIHTLGLLLISKQLSKLYPELKLPELKNVSSKNVEKLLSKLLGFDPSLSIVFTHILKKHLHFDQMLATSSKQWRAAFDILKEKGLADLVLKLKNRQTIYSADTSSFSALLHEMHPNLNASRLRQEILDKTVVKDSEGKVTRPGIDIYFPFRVAQLSRRKMVEVFENPDAIEELYETGRFPNSYDPKEVAKQASKETLRIYRTLLQGEIRKVPIQKNIVVEY